MVIFKHTEDIENWFKSMSYEDFWKEVSAFDIELPAKPICEGKILSGKVDRDIMLGGLKYLASTQLSGKLKLKRRPMGMPDLSEVG